MLTTIKELALEGLSPDPHHDVTTDLDTLSELIFAIAPSARIIREKGVDVFYLVEEWAFALVPHQQNLSLYHASDLDISGFYERLKNVHLGDHCLLIDSLDRVNLNVLVELLALLKVDMVRKHQLDQALH
ncbi:hypothetical protein MAQ5080_00223 [Marinomonas aquimarina]|uniref:Uncharacterized protein n=1 Tax=Marinomonas aquimarina TaxID=295068 RepID=A0A1A8T2R1_9GAMM|nr:hypothetical protein [Marinomonas aquimarina]SBS25271.1 hypothetical protein MAQ5080_00223 [Marinomonas aquimarina]